MKRIELAALCSRDLRWDKLVADLPPALESIGLAHSDSTADGEAVVLDHGEEGCVILFDRVGLAQRAARALATRSGATVMVYEVVGSRGEKRSKFRTTAWRAAPSGELAAAEGRELDLEDPEENWGGGTLDQQANKVLDLFADLDRLADKTLKLGYRRRAPAKASTPRVATLLASLQKAKSFEAQLQADGRVALKMALAKGGTQTSFCTKDEHEELESLLSR